MMQTDPDDYAESSRKGHGGIKSPCEIYRGDIHDSRWRRL